MPEAEVFLPKEERAGTASTGKKIPAGGRKTVRHPAGVLRLFQELLQGGIVGEEVQQRTAQRVAGQSLPKAYRQGVI